MSVIRKSFSPIISLFAIALIAVASHLEPRCETISSPANQAESGCDVRGLVDMAFIIDQSGSMDPRERGQTFNVQIEGIVRALRDPAVIPRDGSVAISVFIIPIPPLPIPPTPHLSLTVINSKMDAESAASRVEALRCACEGAVACPVEGSIGASEYGLAISAASDHLSDPAIGRKNARRVLVLSSDGGCTDEDCGLKAANEAKAIGFELDIILLGSTQEQLQKVLPAPPLPIKPGACNIGYQCSFVDDCISQANKFVDYVRQILRSDVTDISIPVNTENDTPADETPEMIATHNIISLRQAITLANAREGNATITFGEDVTLIQPTTPLPAITQPDIIIDGNSVVTLDGSQIAQGGDGDGLLIQASRTTIRGMRIINFRRAGIAIDPLPDCDRVGRNNISGNHLENNTKAGILVFDVPGEPGSNLRNTLSENTISGQSIPIDLHDINDGPDGRTANDVCDMDEGPNHLINYPESFMATVDGNFVRIEGRAGSDSCPVAGATVEIFTVTTPASAAAQSPVRTVTPVATVIADSEGRFTATVANTSACQYTATVTDAEGNTSEMIPFRTTLPVAVIDVEELIFKETSARGKPLKFRKQPSAVFTITNPELCPLTLRSITINRDEEKGITERDDYRNGKGLFSVRRVIDPARPLDDQEISFGEDGLVIEPGMTMFRVRFNPVIPGVAKCGCSNKLSASEVLPDEVKSSLTLSFNNGVQKTIALKARVKPEPRLINPDRDSPRFPALIVFTRSGEELTVTFSAYESNNKVKTVEYEFFDGQGNSVPVDDPDTELPEALMNLVRGQSFIVGQKFTNARQHPGVSTVRVTITDSQGKPNSAFSRPLTSAAIRLRSAAGESGASPLRAGRPSVFQIPLRSTSVKNERKGGRR